MFTSFFGENINILFSLLSFIISTVLLFPFNGFASPNFFKKVRTVITDFVFPPDIYISHLDHNANTVGTVKALLRFRNEDFFTEDATRQEIFEYFGNVFKRTEKGTSSHTIYTEAIFDSLWEDNEFRGIIFDSITKEDLYKPDFLLKWWEEAKAVGAESRLVEYTHLSLTKIRLEKEPDQFLETAMILMAPMTGMTSHEHGFTGSFIQPRKSLRPWCLNILSLV